MNKAPIAMLIPFVLTACASKPENDPAYISHTYYETYSCKQMTAEKQRVVSQLDQAIAASKKSQLLDTAVSIFAISQGYGVSSGDNVEVQRLQNRFTVLEETMIRKDC